MQLACCCEATTPVSSLAYRSTRPHWCFDFFYTNTNNLVKLENRHNLSFNHFVIVHSSSWHRIATNSKVKVKCSRAFTSNLKVKESQKKRKNLKELQHHPIGSKVLPYNRRCVSFCDQIFHFGAFSYSSLISPCAHRDCMLKTWSSKLVLCKKKFKNP